MVTTADLAEYLRLPVPAQAASAAAAEPGQEQETDVSEQEETETPAAPDPLAIYLNAAKSRARRSGVPEYENNAEYDMFLLALAAMYYDNRGMGTPTVDEQAAKRMIDSFVLGLRHAGEDSEGDGYVYAVALPE